MYPKLRLEEEGCLVLIIGSHAAGMAYKGKHGYPIKSDTGVADIEAASLDALILPGSPRYSDFGWRCGCESAIPGELREQFCGWVRG